MTTRNREINRLETLILGTIDKINFEVDRRKSEFKEKSKIYPRPELYFDKLVEEQIYDSYNKPLIEEFGIKIVKPFFSPYVLKLKTKRSSINKFILKLFPHGGNTSILDISVHDGNNARKNIFKDINLINEISSRYGLEVWSRESSLFLTGVFIQTKKEKIPIIYFPTTGRGDTYSSSLCLYNNLNLTPETQSNRVFSLVYDFLDNLYGCLPDKKNSAFTPQR